MADKGRKRRSLFKAEELNILLEEVEAKAYYLTASKVPTPTSKKLRSGEK